MERAYDHSRFRDHLDAYLAGGLNDAEREPFEAHAAQCPACGGALSEAAAHDQLLRQLFADARPPADLEDRLVRGLRSARPALPLIHPLVRRAAIGVAAALLLGGFGYVANEVIHGGGLPTPWAPSARRVAVSAPLDQALDGARVPHDAERLVRLETPGAMAGAFNKLAKERVGGEWTRQLNEWSENGWVPSYTGMRAPAGPAETNGTEQPKDMKRRVEGEKAQAVNSRPAPAGGFGGGGIGGRATGATDAPVIAQYLYGIAPAADGRASGLGTVKLGGDSGLSLHAGVELGDRIAAVKTDGARFKEVTDATASSAFKPNVYFSDAPPAAAAPIDALQVEAVRNAQAAAPEAEVREEQKGQQAGQSAPVAAKLVSAQPAASAPADPTAGRKIIRNGEMSFEVDGFDSSYMQIVKIAAEEGGFVATIDSEKLANGKVRGTVTVRVPPDRLDTLVLKLRGLGDLKSSRLAAQDITKQYTDLESQLRASRAMEERLLNIIKTGKGEIKDLVEAEKQLGVYREKIEQVEGEIRYYNNLVSLSTLNVTLTERDIRTAAMLSETEQVNMGVEAPDVEAARSAALKAIEEAKGRIIESDLKKLEAGQFAGKIVADVPPDAAGPLIDRMKQIGTVARLEVSRKQSAPEGTVAPAPAQGGAAVKVERRDTRFLISLYNLANVAPRQTTSLNLAAEDVEAAYRTILDQVKSAGGRVVTSQLNRPRPNQTTGTITFESPADGADLLLGAVRAAGEVMRLDVSQNPDAQNVTEAKRGFVVQVFSIASVAPRETTVLRVAARDVAESFNRLRESVRAAQGAQILSSQLKEDDPANVAGSIDFEVRRQDWAAVETALGAAGQVVSRNVTRSADTENTVDTKVRLQVMLVDEAALQPRESVSVQLAVADVPGQHAKLLEALGAAQARILQSQLSEDQAQQNVTGTLVFDVRRENHAAIIQALAEAGDAVSRSVARSTDTQNTMDDKLRLSLTLTDADRLPPRETTTLGMEAADVEKAKEQIEALALGLGGRVVESTLSREPTGEVVAKVVADVPLGRSMEMVRKTRDQGRVRLRRDARDESVPQGSLARARVDVTLANEDLIVESGQGLVARIREGLRTSMTGLLWSVQLIVIGLFLVAPWALIVYFAWRLIRRRRRTAPTPTVA